MPEVLNDLSLCFFFWRSGWNFFLIECLLASKKEVGKKKKTSMAFFRAFFFRLVLSRFPPLVSGLLFGSFLPTWWIEISTAVQVQMPATASRGLLEETSIIFFFSMVMPLSFFLGRFLLSLQPL